jgi:hypothetical protein
MPRRARQCRMWLGSTPPCKRLVPTIRILDTTCGSWHLVKDSNPKMRCAKCGFYTCFSCKCKWHHGLTCREYQEDPDGTNIKSEKAKRRECKRCPARSCGKYIGKEGGCPEITCGKSFYGITPPLSLKDRKLSHEVCGTIFCWECKIILEGTDRYRTKHLSSCTSSWVTGCINRRSVPKPSLLDIRYREGWDRDPDFVGTGRENPPSDAELFQHLWWRVFYLSEKKKSKKKLKKRVEIK